MRKLIFVLAILGCGGGGGGSGERSATDACRQYCLFFCAKVELCQFIPPGGTAECADACLNTALELDRSAESCESTQQTIQDMSCGEIANVFGLSRSSPSIGRILGFE